VAKRRAKRWSVRSGWSVGGAQHAIQVRLRTLVAQVLLAHPAAYQMQQLGLERLANAPEDLVRNALHAVPAALIGEAVLPAETEWRSKVSYQSVARKVGTCTAL